MRVDELYRSESQIIASSKCSRSTMIATKRALFKCISDDVDRRDEYRKYSTSLQVEINAGPVSMGEDCGEK
jgi:hypothetical protein